jgi:hypothetical protein
MNLERLKKGNAIAEEIKKCRANIKAATYTQAENVLIRKSYLKVYGLEESIEVPESLFRIVGKLVLAEYNLKLIELQNELQSI